MWRNSLVSQPEYEWGVVFIRICHFIAKERDAYSAKQLTENSKASECSGDWQADM